MEKKIRSRAKLVLAQNQKLEILTKKRHCFSINLFIYLFIGCIRACVCMRERERKRERERDKDKQRQTDTKRESGVER